jgi:enoyl-CoA hydratase/carnithine racemase
MSESAIPTFDNFLLAVDGPVATVSINRPDKRNALSVGMWRQLAAICSWLRTDSELRAVVVTGVGPSFCAGADISALSEDDSVMKAAVSEAEEALRNLAIPTIAKIRGHCMGGGNQIAVACDLRIVDSSAVFGVPPAKLSVIYAVNSTRALVALVGPAQAKRLIFTAAPIAAPEALRIGLVDEVVAPEELDAAVQALIASMIPLAPLTQVATKEVVNAIASGQDDSAIDAVHDRWYAEWAASADGADGPKAFLERREPNFTWRPAE